MIKSYALLVFVFLGFSSATAQFNGFTVSQAEQQTTIEKLFLELPSSEGFKMHLKAITAEPHPAGSPENQRVADYMADRMTASGFEVQRYPYDIYMPTGPGEVSIALVTPIRQPLNNKEYILESDPFSADPRISHGWNSYSGSGDVTAEVVYVNYGTKQDFEKLTELGISVEGKIVLARYGGNFRGYKAKYAEAAGAAGLIIYTDPEDSGYMKGLVYPEGNRFSESTIQRGSVLTLDWTGDPLTPFEPALPLDDPNTPERLDPADLPFHSIPVAPIAYGAASEILSRMKGRPVPEAWQGGLPFTYRIDGGAQLTVRLYVDQTRDYVRVENVVGMMEGSEFPDEWIIIGGHYDAWSFGATDPNSGTAMLLSLADALGALEKQGHRPRRSILIAHWDAEEHGILGSTEWVEQLREELDAKAVAYFNADGVCSGMNFNGSSSPTLKQLLLDASKAVAYPGGEQTVYEHWLARARDKSKGPGIGNLGGGSDHLGFYAHLGIPSLGAGMGGPTMYHSAYDNFNWYATVGEPNFVAGPTVTRVYGIMALRLANADIIPFDVLRYATDLQQHIATAATRIREYHPDFSTDGLTDVILTLEGNATKYGDLLTHHLMNAKFNEQQIREINQGLIRLERSFIDEKGMAYGRWFRSLYASSDPFSGYASWMLPGLLYEAELERTEHLKEWEARYKASFERLNKSVEALTKKMEIK